MHWIDECTGSLMNTLSLYVNIMVLINELSVFVNCQGIDKRSWFIGKYNSIDKQNRLLIDTRSLFIN